MIDLAPSNNICGEKLSGVDGSCLTAATPRIDIPSLRRKLLISHLMLFSFIFIILSLSSPQTQQGTVCFPPCQGVCMHSSKPGGHRYLFYCQALRLWRRCMTYTTEITSSTSRSKGLFKVLNFWRRHEHKILLQILNSPFYPIPG